MGAFEDIVQMMAGMDIFQLFFPWLFVLAVTYGLLEKHGVFSEDSSVNGVIALAMSFLTIGGLAAFVPAGLFTHFAAAIAFGLFAVIGFMILLAAAGMDLEGDAIGGKSSLPTIGAIVITVVSFIAIIGTYLNVEGILGGVSGGNIYDEVVMPILILVFLLLVVSTVSGSDGDE